MLRKVSIRPTGSTPEEEDKIKIQIAQDILSSYVEFNDFVLFNKIYFKEELANKLEKISKDYWDARFDLSLPELYENMGVDELEAHRQSVEKVLNASRKIREEIPVAIKELENEFRYLLGVNE